MVSYEDSTTQVAQELPLQLQAAQIGLFYLRFHFVFKKLLNSFAIDTNPSSYNIQRKYEVGNPNTAI